ncbi:DUF72 domain-containing protein [Sphingomonas sp. SRS2]|uniref:DUF72 domain-containing protein n=1 Tax=Sphingomonas sp. SRS2 TaxID=133190 RepID=UPI0006184F32|nr:DUF72 domain-containing protein [Sphingomonas sp. SRS2]KKC26392.1 hypothetical protein WP12_08655 [Sphingomonas sp. SRS2]
MTDRVFVGTAGWSIASHYRDDFPETGSHLQRYAARFNAVEINSSFHRPHRRATYERWASSVPDGFRFSVKLPRSITHERRLMDFAAPLAAFIDQVEGLGGKLGAILVQLPPSLIFAEAAADAFLAELGSATGAALICEPRHPSWFSASADGLLRDHDVARVAADPAPVPDAGEPGGSASTCYLRLHGSPVIYRSSYDEERQRGYAAMIVRANARGAAWCIFDNTAGMAAIGDALRFRRLVA